MAKVEEILKEENCVVKHKKLLSNQNLIEFFDVSSKLLASRAECSPNDINVIIINDLDKELFTSFVDFKFTKRTTKTTPEFSDASYVGRIKSGKKTYFIFSYALCKKGIYCLVSSTENYSGYISAFLQEEEVLSVDKRSKLRQLNVKRREKLQ